MMLPIRTLRLSSKWMLVWRGLSIVAISLIAATALFAQTEFNDRPIQSISIVFPNGGPNPTDENEFRSIAEQAVGATYSVVRIRDSIEALHRTNKIVSVEVEAEQAANGVNLRYVIKRKALAQKVSIDLQNVVGEPVTEQEL